jgi:DNA-binding beta-propeller fold protein YncE
MRRTWLGLGLLAFALLAWPAGLREHIVAEAAATTASPGTIVWVSVETAGKVVEVDVGNRDVLRRFDTPGGPHNITVAPDGTVVAALWSSDRIAIIRDGQVEFVALGGAPHDVKIARHMIVVANQGSARVQLVKLDGTFQRRIKLVANPHDLAVDPAQRHAWVTLEGSDDLAVVNLIRRKAVRYVSTGRSPHDILFAPDGTLWVTDWGGSLHVFSVPRGRLLQTIPLGIEAHHMAFTPDGRFAWITDHGADRVFVLRVRTRSVVASKAFPGEPHHVAVTADGRFVVVADHANGRLIVYRAETRRRVGRIRVGAGPHGVWAAPAPA